MQTIVKTLPIEILRLFLKSLTCAFAKNHSPNI